MSFTADAVAGSNIKLDQTTNLKNSLGNIIDGDFVASYPYYIWRVDFNLIFSIRMGDGYIPVGGSSFDLVLYIGGLELRKNLVIDDDSQLKPNVTFAGNFNIVSNGKPYNLSYSMSACSAFLELVSYNLDSGTMTFTYIPDTMTATSTPVYNINKDKEGLWEYPIHLPDAVSLYTYLQITDGVVKDISNLRKNFYPLMWKLTLTITDYKGTLIPGATKETSFFNLSIQQADDKGSYTSISNGFMLSLNESAGEKYTISQIIPTRTGVKTRLYLKMADQNKNIYETITMTINVTFELLIS